MGACPLPLMATKWLDSAGIVTVVLSAFMSMHLKP